MSFDQDSNPGLQIQSLLSLTTRLPKRAMKMGKVQPTPIYTLASRTRVSYPYRNDQKRSSGQNCQKRSVSLPCMYHMSPRRMACISDSKLHSIHREAMSSANFLFIATASFQAVSPTYCRLYSPTSPLVLLLK